LLNSCIITVVISCSLWREIFGNGLAVTDRYSPFLGTGASAPTYPVAGSIWISNSAGIYIYNGSTWVH
jgi:hypothetical protein